MNRQCLTGVPVGHVWSVLENTGQISVNWSNCSNSFKMHVNVSSIVFVSYYLRQVNEVNGGDNAFVRCVSVRVCAAAGHGN